MKASILTIILMIAIGCSSKPDVKEFPKSANAKEEISNLKAALENSKDESYELLAPVSFKEAKASLNNAEDMQKDDDSNQEVLQEVALGQAYLDQAKKHADENKEKLQDIVAAREAALEAKADTLLPKDLAKMDDKVKEETAKLEKDKDSDIKEKRARFITGYLDLELAAIKKDHLGESKFLIDQAVKNGARDLTPKTLATANKDYKAAERYITQNRHDTTKIEELSEESLTSARKLDATLATARGLKASTPEETALKMQAEQDRLNQTQSALTEEQSTTAALTASNSEMEKQKNLNAIYEDARKEFSPEEAEVYKQGQNLVIRLRSLQFPKSQAVLKGQDFALLKKVEDVIGKFDKAAVTVEGHTDSTGGPQINQELSTERAEAVKQYLQANAPDSITEIDAQGFGYQKPLASNKTAAGRAQNRRVDVIIEPVQI